MNDAGIEALGCHLKRNPATLTVALRGIDAETLRAALRGLQDDEHQKVFDAVVDVMAIDADDALEAVWPE